VFLKKTRPRLFSRISELFFLIKSSGIGPPGHEQSLPKWSNGLQRFIKHEPLVSGSAARINSAKGVRELLILIIDQRAGGLGGFFFNCLGETSELRDPPCPATRAALVHAIGHHLLDHKLLRVLGDGRNLFFSLTVVETDHGKRTTGRCLDQFSMMVRAVPGEAPTPVMAPTAVVTTSGPSPSSNSAQEALVRWVDEVSLGGSGG
jgi:hypothetical protein